MGNDWYTFPSSFFLQHNQMHLQFVKSEFTGQLPQPFSEHDGTFAQPRQPFNSLNKEEPSRYIPLSSCNYVVTTVHHPPRTQVARSVAENEGWEATISNPVIDPEHSPTLTRAFYIPRWSNVRNGCVLCDGYRLSVAWFASLTGLPCAPLLAATPATRCTSSSKIEGPSTPTIERYFLAAGQR